MITKAKRIPVHKVSSTQIRNNSNKSSSNKKILLRPPKTKAYMKKQEIRLQF